MAQPYAFGETTASDFEESSSFQYVESFQPYDIGYNEYHTLGSQWPSTEPSERVVSAMPPVYEEMIFLPDESDLQLPQNQASIPYQNLGHVPRDPNVPMYDYPISLEAPQILPCYPKSPMLQVQPLEYSSVIDENSQTGSPSKRPIVALRWEYNDPTTLKKEEPKSVKRQKTINIGSVSQPDQPDTTNVISPSSKTMTPRALEDYMGLFDTSLRATKEKRRRKVFSAHEKKVVKSVRNVGACISCKFRKKTCSAGHPCPYCARLAGSNMLGKQMCQRESPFIGRSLAQYYVNSSRRRILNFKLSGTKITGLQQVLYIDGAGPVNYPLGIEVLKVNTEKLELNDKVHVLRTMEPESGILERPQSLSESINLLKPGTLSRKDLEDWAVGYTSSYSKTKLPHANGFIFGIEYIKKSLPHFDIVDQITRLVSVNFVLRAGVTVQLSSTSDNKELRSPFRTIQAQIDTLLFESFTTIEKTLYRDLQRLVFRSAGSLARDAIIPVCFSVWQLARLQCMLASHLTNLAVYDLKRSRRSSSHSPHPTPSTTPPLHSSFQTSCQTSQSQSQPTNTQRARHSEAANLTHGLNLMLCTFEALFRTACPLLLDWTDPFSRDLLQDDAELLALAIKMGRTLRAYRARGHRRKFKLGFGYDKEMSGRIRGLLRER